MYINLGAAKTIDGFKFAYIFPNCTQGACSSYPGPIAHNCKGNLYYKNQNSQWISVYTCPNLNAYNSSMVCPMEDSVTFTFAGISAQEWKFEMIGNYWLGGGFQTTTYYRVKDIYFRQYSITSPTTQATNLVFQNVQTNQFSFNWADGNGAKRAVFIKQDSVGTPVPLYNTTYTANTVFGSGSQIGTTGWYCVFNGTTHAAGVSVTNLLPDTKYRLMVCEYNGTAGSEQYNTAIAAGNPANQKTCTPLPVSLTISATNTSVCSGTSVVFTSTPTNGGTTPTYQWKLNGINVAGATNANYSFIPVNSDVVTCMLTSSATCVTSNPATSNSVIMAVSPASPITVSIAASANPSCYGTPVTFTATPTNGGATPGYQWMKNNANVSGATNAAYSYVPSHNNQIKCVLTSSLTCAGGNPATSNTITMAVSPNYAVTVSVVASANPVCTGSAVNFIATPNNGGTSPAYQWIKNAVNVTGATNSTYSYLPSNNDQVKCLMTSNLTCVSNNPATSNTITLTVSPLKPVSVSIAASANQVCAGSSVTMNATGVNGGTSPAYQWKVNGVNVSGATNMVYSFVPSNNQTVACVFTSNDACATGNPATSNEIALTVNPLHPVSVSIAASANPFCAGNTIMFTATTVNGGSNPVFQWKVNGVNAGTNSSAFSYNPANGDVVSCVLTSNADCPSGNPASSNPVIMSAMILNPTITGSATACLGNAGATYSTQPDMTGYTWIVSSGGEIVSGAGTNTVSVVWNTSGAQTISVTYGNAAGCLAPSPGILNLTVFGTPGPAGVISGPTEVCVGTQGVTYTIAPILNATNYVWKVPLSTTIASGLGTNSITLNFSSSAFIDDISVKGTNLCFNGPQSPNLTVRSNALLNGQATLTNITIPPAQQACLAAQSITTAGNGTTFLVETGGEVTLIASQFIRFLPGTTVQENGYLEAFITNQCIPCSSLKIALSDPNLFVASPIENLMPEIDARSSVKVYPNPTNGTFTLEFEGDAGTDKIRVEIYGMRGEILLSKELTGKRKHLLSLADRPVGVYFIRVVAGMGVETIKLVKE